MSNVRPGVSGYMMLTFTMHPIVYEGSIEPAEVCPVAATQP